MTRIISARTKKLIYTIVVFAVVFILIFPFYVTFDVSIKPLGASKEFPRSLITLAPTIEHYVRVLIARNLVHHMLVTAFVGLGTTVLALVLAILASFSLSRFRFRGQNFFSRAVLMVYMFPPILLVVPLFLIYNRIGLNDTLLALILTDTTFSLPFAIWMLKSFFDVIPSELDDAALIDGCNSLSVIWYVILPVAGPGVVATAVFCFMLAWGEYLFALTFINSQALQPITVAMYSLIGPYAMNPGVLMAASVLSAVPPVIFFFIAQKWIIAGLTAGAVKG